MAVSPLRVVAAVQAVFWSLEVKYPESSLASESSSRMTRMPSFSPFINSTVTARARASTRAHRAEKCLPVDIGPLL